MTEDPPSPDPELWDPDYSLGGSFIEARPHVTTDPEFEATLDAIIPYDGDDDEAE